MCAVFTHLYVCGIHTPQFSLSEYCLLMCEIHKWRDLSICDVTHSCDMRPIHTWCDSFIFDMTHSYLTTIMTSFWIVPFGSMGRILCCWRGLSKVRANHCDAPYSINMHSMRQYASPVNCFVGTWAFWGYIYIYIYIYMYTFLYIYI